MLLLKQYDVKYEQKYVGVDSLSQHWMEDFILDPAQTDIRERLMNAQEAARVAVENPEQLFSLYDVLDGHYESEPGHFTPDRMWWLDETAGVQSFTYTGKYLVSDQSLVDKATLAAPARAPKPRSDTYTVQHSQPVLKLPVHVTFELFYSGSGQLGPVILVIGSSHGRKGRKADVFGTKGEKGKEIINTRDDLLKLLPPGSWIQFTHKGSVEKEFWNDLYTNCISAFIQKELAKKGPDAVSKVNKIIMGLDRASVHDATDCYQDAV